MTKTPSASPWATAAGPLRLKRNVLGLVGVATMGAVIMSPSLGLYFNWAPMSTTTGKIAPLIFLVALLISLPTAVSYAMVSKELPAAGQAYTWLWRALRPSAGIWLGPIFVMYYLAGIWLVNMFFGLFFAEFLRYFGVPDNQWRHPSASCCSAALPRSSSTAISGSTPRSRSAS